MSIQLVTRAASINVVRSKSNIGEIMIQANIKTPGAYIDINLEDGGVK